MRTVELISSKRSIKNEVPDEQFAWALYRARLSAELRSRNTGEKWSAREFRDPPAPPKQEELDQAEREERISQKGQEILRRMAIEELEAEKERG